MSDDTGRVFERPKTIEEAYNQCQHLVRGVVNHFLKRYGGDIEEWMSDANYAFVIAYTGYDETKGESNFGRRVCGVVRNILLDKLQRDYKNTNRSQARDPSLFDLMADRVDYDLIHETNELSPDAQNVIKMTLDLPQKVNDKKGKPRRLSKRRMKKILIKKLTRLGWNGPRISSSFREISENLT